MILRTAGLIALASVLTWGQRPPLRWPVESPVVSSVARLSQLTAAAIDPHSAMMLQSASGDRVVRAIGFGRVARISCSERAILPDCVGTTCTCPEGAGVTVVVEHRLSRDRPLYSVYGGMALLARAARVGACVAQGAPLGELGGERRPASLRFELHKVAPRSDGEDPDPWEVAQPSEWIGKRSVLDGTAEDFLLPDGRPPLHPPGTIIRTRDSNDIYVIRAGRSLLRIPGTEALSSLYENGGRGLEHVITVSRDEFAQYWIVGSAQPPLPGNGTRLPEGTLIRDPKARMAIVTETGGRRQFASVQAFEGLGFSFCNSVPLSNEEYEAFPLESGVIDGSEDPSAVAERLAAANPSAMDEYTLLEEDEITAGLPMEGRTPLILIHGIHGNRYQGEDDIRKPNKDYFLRLLLFLENIGDLGYNSFRDRFKVFRFHYRSDKEEVHEIALALRNRLNALIGTETPIVILAHSMGGLVARSYMNDEDIRAGDRVLRLITLATPHHGTHIANQTPRVWPKRYEEDWLWETELEAFTIAYWVKYGCELCALFPGHPNRGDLRSDNSDNLWDSDAYSGDEVNAWLRGIPHYYDSRIVPYWGQLGMTDLTRQLWEMGPAKLFLWITNNDEDHERLAAVGVVLQRIITSNRNHQSVDSVAPSDVENDGFVPKGSAAFDGLELLRRECRGHDHLHMLEGSRRRCETGKRLFPSILDDLYAAVNPPAPPTAPALESLSISPATVTGGATATGQVRLTAPAGGEGVVIQLSSSSPIASVPGFVTVSEGASVSTFAIGTSAVTQNLTVTITATYLAVSRTSQLLIQPPVQQSASATVPAIASIVLAGQPDGAKVRNDSSPLNSPVQVSMGIAGGQVLQFTATGMVDVDGRANPQTPPEGNVAQRAETASIWGTSRDLGIAQIAGPAGALVGVFLGPDTPDPRSAPPNVDFYGATRDLVSLTPMLQQPFLIGRGTTPTSKARNVIVPEGATRLFLGVLDTYGQNNNNTGTFRVTVSLAPLPPPAVFPMVPATASIILAGQPPGRQLRDRDGSPLNSPVLVPMSISGGQVLQFAATGMVDVDGRANPQTPPEGNVSQRVETTSIWGTSRDLGIAQIGGPAGALVGVFLGPDPPDPRSAPPNVDFYGAARDVMTQTPMLHQPFLIGRGTTPAAIARDVVVPAGATRLVLGVLDTYGQNYNNTGTFLVTVSVASSPPPTLFPMVPATASIILAGQLSGRQLREWDGSPLNSPVLVPMSISGGQVFQFAATGMVDVNGSANPQTPPEGNVSQRIETTSIWGTSRDLGIAQIAGPAGTLVGVFLGPDTPDPRSAPPNVDFFGSGRDVEALRPLLHQPFVIGRGLTPGGRTRNVTAPSGATRLFLGILDTYGQNYNNTGTFTVTVSAR